MKINNKQWSIVALQEGLYPCETPDSWKLKQIICRCYITWIKTRVGMWAKGKKNIIFYALHFIHTLFSMHCFLWIQCIVLLALFYVHLMLYIVLYALQSMQHFMYHIQLIALYTLHSIKYVKTHSIQCIVSDAFNVIHCILYIEFFILNDMHYILCIGLYTLLSMHAFCTLHYFICSALFAMHYMH